MSFEPSTLFCISVVLFSGLILGRVVKFVRLPNVTGYLLAGLILGPYGLGLFSREMVHM